MTSVWMTTGKWGCFSLLIYNNGFSARLDESNLMQHEPMAAQHQLMSVQHEPVPVYAEPGRTLCGQQTGC